MSLRTKQNVKQGKISPKDAYDKLHSLLGEEYVTLIPTMRWLKNLVEGRKIVQKVSQKLDKKIDFKKKKFKK